MVIILRILDSYIYIYYIYRERERERERKWEGRDWLGCKYGGIDKVGLSNTPWKSAFKTLAPVWARSLTIDHRRKY